MRNPLARNLCNFLSVITAATAISICSQNAKSEHRASQSQSTTNSQSGASQSCDEIRENLQRLNQEMPRLRKRLAELEKDRQINTIQDMLTREEQRGEGLQLHLIEIAEKEEPLQARMDQLNQNLKPERIESIMSGVGSVHPEEAREELRRRIINERGRVQMQLELLRQDKMRTLASLRTTDEAIQRLKLKLTEAIKE
ncbi:MAG TPA: hypothetical protein VFH91_08560 [Pyrinomonadaceae bacterium]|nr:hypothetical protein [Pyrinomonadaceae bacterium]